MEASKAIHSTLDWLQLITLYRQSQQFVDNPLQVVHVEFSRFLMAPLTASGYQGKTFKIDLPD